MQGLATGVRLIRVNNDLVDAFLDVIGEVRARRLTEFDGSAALELDEIEKELRRAPIARVHLLRSQKLITNSPALHGLPLTVQAANSIDESEAADCFPVQFVPSFSWDPIIEQAEERRRAALADRVIHLSDFLREAAAEIMNGDASKLGEAADKIRNLAA